MRVNESSMQGLVQSISDLTAQQADLNSQLASGIRLNRLSDDASASGRAMVLADTLSRDVSFLSTASTADSRMQASDTALSSVVTQLNAAVTSAVGAVNQNTSASARSIAVQQLKSIRSSLVTLANSSYGGTYLFSGSGTSVPFTQASDGSVTYAGNNDTTNVALASGATIQGSLAGSALFLAPGASVFGAMNDLISNLDAGTVDSTNESSLVSSLRDALTNVSSQRAGLNMAQNRLSGETDYITAQKTNAQAEQTSLLAADPVALATELSSATTRRSALLNTIALVQKGSIFDYI